MEGLKMLIIEVSFRRHFVSKLKEKTAWIFDTYLHIWIFRLETSLDTISSIMVSNWKGESRWQVITSHWVSGEKEQEVAAGDGTSKVRFGFQSSISLCKSPFIEAGYCLSSKEELKVLSIQILSSGATCSICHRGLGTFSSSNSSWHTSFWPRHVEKRPCFAFYKAHRRGRQKKEENEMDHREGITKG